MSMSFKNFIYFLPKDMETIATDIERGNYGNAIKACNDFLKSDRLLQQPLSSASWIQSRFAFLYLKAFALIGHFYSFRVQSEDELDAFFEDFNNTMAEIIFDYDYLPGKYRHQIQPRYDILLAEFQYIDEEGYEFNDWLLDCIVALEMQKKRKGQKNQLEYASLLIQVSFSSFRKVKKPNEQIKVLIQFWLNEAINICKKYHPGFEKDEIKMKIDLLLSQTQRREDSDLSQLGAILTTMKQHIDTDNPGKDDEEYLAYLSEKSLAAFLQYYQLTIQGLGTNDKKSVCAFAQKAIEFGLSWIKQRGNKIDLQLTTQMQNLTNIYLIRFGIEKESSYLSAAISLWKKLIDEIQNNNRENRSMRFANMSEEERLANITQKDIIAVLTDGLNYNFTEAYVVLTAELVMAICYLCGGDIQDALICKDEMEQILERNEEFFDEEVSSFLVYPLYFCLSQYYHKNQQDEEAEKYQRLYLLIKDALFDSQYSEEMAFYDRLFDTIIKFNG